MKIIKDDFRTAKITGPGKYEENKIGNVISTTPNLKTGAIYLILPQIAHSEPRLICKADGTEKEVDSNRFGAIEFIDNQCTGIVSIAASLLRATYLSDDMTQVPEVKMEFIKDGWAKGLNRPIFGQDFNTPVLDQPAPIEIRPFIGVYKKIVMTKPFAFKVVGRKNYWSLIFQEDVLGRWDMLVDDDMNAKVQRRRDYVLEAVEIPAGKYDLKSFIPRLADYAL